MFGSCRGGEDDGVPVRSWFPHALFDEITVGFAYGCDGPGVVFVDGEHKRVTGECYYLML